MSTDCVVVAVQVADQEAVRPVGVVEPAFVRRRDARAEAAQRFADLLGGDPHARDERARADDERTHGYCRCSTVARAFFASTQRLVFVVGQVDDVHPGVRHFVDGAIAVADPLIRIGIVGVVLRVVVPRADLDHRALREHRRRIIRVDVVGHPVEVEVADVAHDLRAAVGQDGLHFHRLAAQVEVRLEVGDHGVFLQHREALGVGHRVRRDVEEAALLQAGEANQVAALRRFLAFRIQPQRDLGADVHLFAGRRADADPTTASRRA